MQTGEMVRCVQGNLALESGRLYTVNKVIGEYVGVGEIEGMWKKDRFARLQYSEGDQIVCIEGNDKLVAGKVYTFQRYNRYNDSFLFVKENSTTSWDKDRFVPATKGSI